MVEYAEEKHSGNNELTKRKIVSAWVLFVRCNGMLDRIPVTSSIDSRELKIRVMHKAFLITLSKVAEICLHDFLRRTGWNPGVNCS